MAQSASQPELRAMFDEKVRRGIFNPVARYLPSDVVEDRLQDAIALTWSHFERTAAERHAVLPDAILVNLCRWRAIEPHRRYVPCEGADRAGCVLDARNYREGRVEVLHLDGVLGPDDEFVEGDRELLGLAEATCVSPVRKLNSALDLDAWLAGLDERDRELLALRAAGYTLGEIGEVAGLSVSQVWARCRVLGEELAQRAGVAPPRRQRRADQCDVWAGANAPA